MTRTLSRRGIIVAAIITGVLAAGIVTIARDPGILPEWTQPQSREQHTVDEVLDGDTIDVIDTDGNVKRVRLLGVDAPDIGNPQGASQCGADEAAAIVDNLLPSGASVYLVSDSKMDDEDEEGNLLRYIETEHGTDVGLEVLSAGYGNSWRPDGGGTYDRFEEYNRAATVALDHNTGAWSKCDLTSSSGETS